MQVNLSTNISQSRPNFKASFSDDIDTKLVLSEINRSSLEQINLLATHYALQDMAPNDKISLKKNVFEDVVYARNLANGREIRLYEHEYINTGLSARLREAIAYGELIDEGPKLDMDIYIKKAVDIIDAASEKENCIGKKLEQQIARLEKDLKNLKHKLWTVRLDENNKRTIAVEKEIFSLTEKVK